MSGATPPQLSSEKKTSKLGQKHPKQANIIFTSQVETSLRRVPALRHLSEDAQPPLTSLRGGAEPTPHGGKESRGRQGGTWWGTMAAGGALAEGKGSTIFRTTGLSAFFINRQDFSKASCSHQPFLFKTASTRVPPLACKRGRSHGMASLFSHLFPLLTDLGPCF